MQNEDRILDTEYTTLSKTDPEPNTNNGQTYTAEEMEKMFPGFSEKIEDAKIEAQNPMKDGLEIGGKHYTPEQLAALTKKVGARRQWTKAEKKARNKKNKAAAKQRRANRLRSK